jgi:hypothetical protein
MATVDELVELPTCTNSIYPAIHLVCTVWSRIKPPVKHKGGEHGIKCGKQRPQQLAAAMIHFTAGSISYSTLN